jgi:hypothetical protein
VGGELFMLQASRPAVTDSIRQSLHVVRPAHNGVDVLFWVTYCMCSPPEYVDGKIMFITASE